MSDLFASDVPLGDQIAELERELEMRRRNYPKWIAAGTLKREKAEMQIARLEAAVKTLRAVTGAGATA